VESYLPDEISGSSVNQLRFDYSFALLLSGQITVQFESRFRLDSSGRLDWYEPPVRVGSDRLLELLGQKIESVQVSDLGDILIDFDGGAEIACPASKSVEAWSIVSRDGSQLLSLPGGGITAFGPRLN
jgi:hypothetical protein